MLDAKTIEEYLHRDEWPFEKVDGNTWQSAFKGENRSFRFFIRLTNYWIFFTIVPFVEGPISVVNKGNIYRKLLEINREINLAKFALDDDEDIMFTVELPIENVGFAQFKEALETLMHYADRTYPEVANLVLGEQKN